MSDCKHDQFKATVQVVKLMDEHDPAKLVGYRADIKIHCMECNEQFYFCGVPAGVSLTEPRTNFEGTELRLPIAPPAKAPATALALLKKMPQA